MKNSILKKIAFFWLIFHLIAFISFKLQWTPSFKVESKKTNIVHYILTPKYENDEYTISDINRVETKMKNMMFPDCQTCPYFESNYFYPFHKFTYSINNGYSPYQNEFYENKGFVGIFGYYGNNEFIVYVVVPLLMYLLILLYKKLFKTKN